MAILSTRSHPVPSPNPYSPRTARRSPVRICHSGLGNGAGSGGIIRRRPITEARGHETSVEVLLTNPPRVINTYPLRTSTSKEYRGSALTSRCVLREDRSARGDGGETARAGGSMRGRGRGREWQKKRRRKHAVNLRTNHVHGGRRRLVVVRSRRREEEDATRRYPRPRPPRLPTASLCRRARRARSTKTNARLAASRSVTPTSQRCQHPLCPYAPQLINTEQNFTKNIKLEHEKGNGGTESGSCRKATLVVEWGEHKKRLSRPRTL